MADIEHAAARWWLTRRFELEAMERRLQALAFDAGGDKEWYFRLDVARGAVTLAVKLADERAAGFLPDELERRRLREELRRELQDEALHG